MDVSSIKSTSWIISVALGLGLGYTVWDYVARDGSRRVVNEDGRESLVVVDPEYVRSVLEANVRLDVDVKHGLAYKGELERTFLRMNWTGYEAPVVVKPTLEEPISTGPRYKPLDTVVRVLMLAVNDLDAGGSFSFVHLLPGEDPLELRVGDTLPEPNDYAVVHAIRNTGLEFAFKEAGRPNESLAPMSMDDGNLITKLGEGGVLTATGDNIPRVKRKRSKRPSQTEELGNNLFLLGTEDLDYFGKNYAAILTDEVQTATHYDENGKRAGIEIKSIASGSVASRHGAQAGDVLISINGQPVSSEHEAINFVKNNQDQYSVWEVVVERLGRRETIVYTDPDN
ncbi:MAG: PDZ domain-containing protein [Planctomycetota bacterium]|nr:PDZ domain-containing protein [Planctomycetota bacterium]